MEIVRLFYDLGPKINWDDYHSAPRVRSKAVNVTAVLYPIMEYNLRAYNSSKSY